MKKFLAFFVLLAGLSFFLTEASSIEIEIQKESDRVIESMGWLEPEKVAYQEQLQIVIDYTGSKNRLYVGMFSTDPNDIQFPDYMEDISNEPKIISFIITNQFACAPNKIEQACVIIDVEREGMGKSIPDIMKNTREITDEIVGDGVILFAAEFDSVSLQPKTNLDGSKEFVSRAVYTIIKPATSVFFNAMGSMIISTDIRTNGGFYDYAEELAKNDFSAFTISLIPQGESMLRTVHVSLTCSDEISYLVRCPENITEQVIDGKISPLDFIGLENVNRTEMFANEFLILYYSTHPCLDLSALALFLYSFNTLLAADGLIGENTVFISVFLYSQ